jgi:hypothetical protein
MKQQKDGEMKVWNENDTRKRLLRFADLIGAREDLEHAFAKWDAVMKLAPPSERPATARQAILEIDRLLDTYSALSHGLTINGEIVIPAAKKPKESK